VAIVNGRFNQLAYRFAQLAGTTVAYQNADGATATLTKDTVADLFTLTDPHQAVTQFYGFNTPGVPPGRLKSVAAADGSTSSFQYQQINGAWRLTGETDTAGRQITYAYATLPPAGSSSSSGSPGATVLSQVTDFLGRAINLQYDANGNLVALVRPSVNSGVAGNTFPGGKAYALQYDSANPDPNRRGDILKVFYPAQVAPYLNATTRVVDVASVYANATPRQLVTYGQNAADPATYGLVLSERIGDGVSAGGTATFGYQFAAYGATLPAGTALRTTMTDPNGNVTLHDFDAKGNRIRLQVNTNRTKSSANPASFVTAWTYAATDNLLLGVTHPAGNSVAYTYDDGVVRDPTTLAALFTLRGRTGFRLTEARSPGTLGGDQAQLTTSRFPDPVFNQELVSIDPRGNPIAVSGGVNTYYAPQDGGATPSDADRSRYATWTRYDYEEDPSAANQQALAAMLAITPAQFTQLLAWQNHVLTAGGLPQGYQFGLGDVNGDGITGQRMGNPIAVTQPAVALIAGSHQAGVEGSTTQTIRTITTYNNRGQVTTETSPEGNVTAYVRFPENDPDGGPATIPGKGTRQYGYLKAVYRDVDPSTLATLIGSGATGGDLTSFTLKVPRRNTPGTYLGLATGYTYDRAGNRTSVTDPRGNATTTAYNELAQPYSVTAPAPFAHQVQTSYDANDNVTRVDTQDLVAQPLSTDSTNVNYMKVPVTVNSDGVTANFPVQAGPGGTTRPGWFSDAYTCDFLDRRLTESRDATGSTPAALTTTWAYDAVGNRTRETRPAGNTVEWDYDERNLVIAERRGGNDPTVAATTVNVADPNGNLAQAIDAADTDGSTANNATVTINNAFGSGSALAYTGDLAAQHQYDGYDRATLTTDAVGGTVARTYDPAGHEVLTQWSGQVGGPSPTDTTGTGNALLARTHAYFDALGRQYEEQRDVFLPAGVALGSGRAVTHTGGGLQHNSTANGNTGTVTLTAGGSSYVLERTEYDRASRVAFRVTDGVDTTTLAYDGADRQVQATDPAGNVEQRAYDANGNVAQVTRTEVSQLAGVAGEVFVARYASDALDRPTWSQTQGPDGSIAAAADNQVEQTAFNSRGLATHHRDPLDNTRVRAYDGSGRLVQTQEHLRLDGTGATAPDPSQSGDGIITTRQAWDGNSRLASLTDDNTNTTSFAYDALDRRRTLTFADSGTRTWGYDLDSNVTAYTDENGSVSTRAYDALNRPTGESIARAAGVVGTTHVTMQYDGQSRPTRATDDGDPADPSQASVATFTYDALGRRVEESLQVGSAGTARYTTGSAWQAEADRTGLTYPNGRTVTATYDALDRLKTLGDAGAASPIATWTYIGAGRLLELAYQNGLCLTRLNDARTASANQPGMPAGEVRGYDGVGRVIAHRWLPATLSSSGYVTGYTSTTPAVGFRHAYDAANGKLSEAKLHDVGNSEAYRYDSAHRLLEADRGTLNAALTAVATPTATAGVNQAQRWTLDGPGNWPSVASTIGGTATTQSRTHNALNQITALGGTPLTYDAAGNLTGDGTYAYAWDARARLRRVTRAADGVVVGQYAYDAYSRRVRRVFVVGTGAAQAVNYYLDGDRVIEERTPAVGGSSSGSPSSGAGGEPLARQYTYGPGIDEVLTLDRDLNNNGIATDAGERLFYHANVLGSVFGLSNSSGAFAERWMYDAYGNPILWLPGPDGLYGTADDTYQLTGVSPVGNVRLFTGREWDRDATLYFYRARFQSPVLGRFTSRDPLAYLGGPNLYAYVRNRPTLSTDPSGLIEPVTCILIVGGVCLLFAGCSSSPKRHCAVKSGPTYAPTMVTGTLLLQQQKILTS